MNGKVLSEQVGAQIFIDGWALVAPGNPERAASLARTAACVSYDGEAVAAAQLLAAMEAQAFRESDLDRLLDTALRLIPKPTLVYRMVNELRELRARENDWRAARSWIEAHYGYDWYGGNCHVIPNHAQIWIQGRLLFDVLDKDATLDGGGVGLVCEEGCITAGPIKIRPSIAGRSKKGAFSSK